MVLRRDTFHKNIKNRQENLPVFSCNFHKLVIS